MVLGGGRGAHLACPQDWDLPPSPRAVAADRTLFGAIAEGAAPLSGWLLGEFDGGLEHAGPSVVDLLAARA